MTRRHQPRPYDDQDDAFDENGLLKDGRRFRVGLADSMTPLQRAVAQDNLASGRYKIFEQMRTEASEITSDAAALVVDAFGDSGAGLHRPGARYLHAGHRTLDHATQVTLAEARSQAQALADAEATHAWKGGPQPGDSCTIDGWPGTLVKKGDDFVCRPLARQDAQSARDEIERLHRLHDAEESARWKGAHR
jgi:hypothetical protein